MRFNRLVFSIAVFSTGAAHAYDGTVHNLITEQAMSFLTGTKEYYNDFLSTTVAENGPTYRDIIRDAACEPDRDGKELTNAEIRNNSDLTSYDFEASVAKDIDAAVKILFSGVHPFVALDPAISLNSSVFGVSTFKLAVETALKSTVCQKADSKVTELKRATQHTYVKGEGVFGETFNDVSIAPYSAQADYNLAVKAWMANNRAEAIRRLGRVLHYVQDMTVPHHASLDINIPDVARAAVELIRSGKDNIAANSSQVRYEKVAALAYMQGTFNQNLLQNYKAQLLNNNDIGRTVPDILIGIRSQIKQSQLMGTVDGYSNGGLAKKKGILAWAKKLWNQIVQGVKDFASEVVAELKKLKDAFIQGVRNTAADQLEQVVEEHLNSTYLYRSVNDDFAGTAAALVPIAIVESAKILDRFATEVGLNVCGAGKPGCRRPATKLHRMTLNCNGGLVIGEQVADLSSGYRNYTCGNRYQEQCIKDGSFDVHYVEWCEYAGPTCTNTGNKRYACDPGTVPPGTCRPTVLHRSVYDCNGTLRSPEMLIDLSSGYRNYKCANRFKEYCVEDGTWDAYYSEWCDYVCN